MASRSLLDLPVELIHRIFHYCDTHTILESIRLSCRQMYAVVNTYSQYKLVVDSKSIDAVNALVRIIGSENIISLTIVDVYTTNSFISQVISLLDHHQISRLRFMDLHKIQHKNLEHLLQNLDTNSSTSPKKSHESQNLPSPILNGCKRQKLCLDNMFCMLQHLIIAKCNYSEYLIILHRLPALGTLVMEDCIVDGVTNKSIFSNVATFNHSLNSLIITACSLSTQDFELLFLPIASLRHLKLISLRRTFDTMFNASYWEQLVSNKLSQLDKLEFLLSYQYGENENFNNFEFLIVPFRTQFWLLTKCWFVTSAFALKSLEIWIHTTPINTSNNRELVRYEVSWIDNTCHLTKRPLNSPISNNSLETLNTLDLHNIHLGEQRLQYLAEALVNNKTVLTLSLFSNQIGDKGMQHLANALQNNTTLTTLDIIHNHIGVLGSQYLAATLKSNTTLAMLSLYNNRIGDEGVQYLTDALKTNTTLTELNLGGNQIGEKGAQYLSNTLKDNMTLNKLYLSFNQIGTLGAGYLANALPSNKTLAMLYLHTNQIGAVGAQTLANALRTNTTLVTLDLYSNQIGDSGAQHFVNALQNNTTVITLDLACNQISYKLQDCIQKLLKQNKVV